MSLGDWQVPDSRTGPEPPVKLIKSGEVVIGKWHKAKNGDIPVQMTIYG